MATGTIGRNSNMVLLWTNSAPTSAFAAQTISLDLSAYEEVCIEYANGTTLDIYYQDYCRVGVSARLTYLAGSNTFSISHRQANVGSSGVQFLGGIQGGSSGNNSICIPTRIYGIKA